MRALPSGSTRTRIVPNRSRKRSSRLAGRTCQPGCSVSGTKPKFSLTGGEPLKLPLHHELLDLGNRARRRETFGAHIRAVHDGVAAIETEWILEIVEPLAGMLVAAVGEPAIGLEQNRGAEELVAVPPVARAGAGAAGAQDAFVEAVELGAVFRRL